MGKERQEEIEMARMIRKPITDTMRDVNKDVLSCVKKKASLTKRMNEKRRK